MINNISAKINFSDKDKTILSVNHNYYVRTAIATIADMIITLLICLCIQAVVTVAAVLIGVSMEGQDSGERMMNTILVGAIAIDVFIAIFYFIYVIAKIARVSHMRKHINRIEDEIVRNSTVAEQKAEEPKEKSQDTEWVEGTK